MTAVAQSDAELHAIAAEVRGLAGSIARRITDATFQDPFWTKRYGDRGRKRTEEDAAFHVEYLVQAFVARDAEIMRRYARWLQTLLTSRGMCTAHLDENFARVGAAILSEVPRAQSIEGYVKAARAALVYAGGPPREVQSAAERADVSIRELMVYLADALALGQATSFSAHVRFADGYGLLDRLSRTIGDDSRISVEAKMAARETIDAARARS